MKKLFKNKCGQLKNSIAQKRPLPDDLETGNRQSEWSFSIISKSSGRLGIIKNDISKEENERCDGNVFFSISIADRRRQEKVL